MSDQQNDWFVKPNNNMCSSLFKQLGALSQEIFTRWKNFQIMHCKKFHCLLISWKEILVLRKIVVLLSISTNRRYCLKHTSSTETDLSGHHHLISSMMKTKFEKEEPIVLVYRDYKHFSFNNFKSELLFKFHHANVIFTSFENNLVNVLNQQAPKKPKIFLRQSKAPFK